MAAARPVSRSSFDKDTASDVYIEDVGKAQAQKGDPNYKFNQAKLKSQLTPDERRALLQAALEVDPGVKPWTWPAIRNVLILLVTCCCGL
jgi:hypothetical protein